MSEVRTWSQINNADTSVEHLPRDHEHHGLGQIWYWARTCDKASHGPIPIPLGYRGHKRISWKSAYRSVLFHDTSCLENLPLILSKGLTGDGKFYSRRTVKQREPRPFKRDEDDTFLLLSFRPTLSMVSPMGLQKHSHTMCMLPC
ncbi:hypothetical protein TNCV_1666761 [Trichonephila clavipes]|nr:hypothetical protein TNCV_1666761 [Trichonephila clavipes]